MTIDTYYKELSDIELELKKNYPTETQIIDFTELRNNLIETTNETQNLNDILMAFEKELNEMMIKNKIVLAVDRKHIQIIELLITEKVLKLYPDVNRKFIIGVLLSLTNVLQVIWSYARIQYVNHYFVTTFDYKSVHTILDKTVSKACEYVKQHSLNEDTPINKVSAEGLDENKILFSYFDIENAKEYFKHDKLSTTSKALQIVKDNDFKRTLLYLNTLERYGFFLNKSMLFLDVEDFYSSLPPYLDDDTFNEKLFNFITSDSTYLLSTKFVQADKDYLRNEFKNTKLLSLLNKDEITKLEKLKTFSKDSKNPIHYEKTKELKEILEIEDELDSVENEQLLLNDAYKIILKSLNNLKAEGLINTKIYDKYIQLELVKIYKNTVISKENPISDLVSNFNYSHYCTDIDTLIRDYLKKLTSIYTSIENVGFEVDILLTHRTPDITESMKIYLDNIQFDNVPIMPNIKLAGLINLKYLTTELESKKVENFNHFLLELQQRNYIISTDNMSNGYYKEIIKQKVLQSNLDNKYISYIQDEFTDSDLPNNYIPLQLVRLKANKYQVIPDIYFEQDSKIKIFNDIDNMLKKAVNLGKEYNILISEFANFLKNKDSENRLDRIEYLLTKIKLSNKTFSLQISDTITTKDFETRYLIIETNTMKYYINPHYYVVIPKDVSKQSKILARINISDSPIPMWEIIFNKTLATLLISEYKNNPKIKKDLKILYAIVKKGYNRKNKI